MDSQLCLPHLIVIYCTRFIKGLHRFHKGKVHELVLCKYSRLYTLAGYTTGKSGVAAETVKLVSQFPRLRNRNTIL